MSSIDIRVSSFSSDSTKDEAQEIFNQKNKVREDFKTASSLFQKIVHPSANKRKRDDEKEIEDKIPLNKKPCLTNDKAEKVIEDNERIQKAYQTIIENEKNYTLSSLEMTDFQLDCAPVKKEYKIFFKENLQPLSEIEVNSRLIEASNFIREALTIAQGKERAQTFIHALNCLIPLVIRKNTEALNIIGNMFLKGYGVVKSSKEGYKCLLLSAKEGNITALTNLGLLHEKGIGIPQSYPVALICYQRAADKGNGEAINALKRLNEMGHYEQFQL